jgi:diguanylate cyclase (GGDEF)-like protein
MTARGEPFGVLLLLATAAEEERGASAFAEEQRQLAAAIAERVALSLSNLRLRDELRGHSIRDALTGLFNRRFMEESLSREVARASRRGDPLAVVMIDLDHFKRFNDAYGHEAGDEVLRAFGEFLRGRTRGGDVACRYGGEEFALILPGATLEDGAARAEEIRRQSKLVHVRLGERSLGPVTLSLGVAALPEHGASAADLLRAADHALYEAKNGGRDRVVLAATAPL